MFYAGDLSPSDAYSMLLERPNAVLVDVRTKAEWAWVGVPDIAGTRFVEWTGWPGGEPNPEFIADASDGLDRSQPILMLCRSGSRSAAAAAALTQAGFTEVYNVAEGFEGDLDHEGHRIGGWRGSGLPWKQT
jgi:rhodanese-related sulfurtransferase